MARLSFNVVVVRFTRLLLLMQKLLSDVVNFSFAGFEFSFDFWESLETSRFSLRRVRFENCVAFEERLHELV